MSVAKLVAGVFNGPQIRELMKDTTFDEVSTEAEKRAWESFKNISLNFLGKSVAQTMKIWFMSQCITS